jgi:type II secretory pathway component PulL
VTLNSDAKSDIEGLRWVLIRRSVLGIIFMAVLTLGTIRYTTYIGHQRQKEADQQAKEAEEIKKNNGRSDFSPGPDAAEILAAN